MRLRSFNFIQWTIKFIKVFEQRYNMIRMLFQEGYIGIYKEDVKGIKLLDYYGNILQEIYVFFKYVLEFSCFYL